MKTAEWTAFTNPQWTKSLKANHVREYVSVYSGLHSKYTTFINDSNKICWRKMKKSEVKEWK